MVVIVDWIVTTASRSACMQRRAMHDEVVMSLVHEDRGVERAGSLVLHQEVSPVIGPEFRDETSQK